MARRGPDAVDKLVGRNIRVLRLAKGLSQTELADELGVTFQQVQKYEKGTNRVGSGRLLKISGILGVKITDFFEGTDRMHDTARRSVFDQLAQPEFISARAGVFRHQSPEHPPHAGETDRADRLRAVRRQRRQVGVNSARGCACRDLARYEIVVPALVAGIRVLKAAPKQRRGSPEQVRLRRTMDFELNSSRP